MSDLTFALLPWQQTVYLDQTRFKVILLAEGVASLGWRQRFC
jgi:hypothetical protein